jgi:hypothetical protein
MLKPLQSPPAVSGDIVALYPKDITGTVYLTDSTGQVLPGWPVRGGGVSQSGPMIYERRNRQTVIYLSQSGILNLWNTEGQYLEGFPMTLDGVFHARPAVFRQDGQDYIAVINDSGLGYIITMDGRILAEKKLNGMRSNDTKILAADTDNDGNQELFFYGGRDFMVRTDGFLQVSPGFPVKGYTAPLFVDMDSDGRKELVTAGLDNQLYIYTMED